MSKLRLIPKLQLCNASYNQEKLVLVITKKFTEIIEIGNPISQAKIFQDQKADELIFININKNNFSQLNKLAEIINDVSKEIFMPLTAGGGVRSLEDIRLLLNNGADKVSINSFAFEKNDFISRGADKYGSQCIVVSIDYKKDSKGKYFVYVNGGKTKTNVNPIEWAMRAENLGAGEILLTSIDSDGAKMGMDLYIADEVSKVVNVPVICSGGCGLAEHFSKAFLETKVSAVAAGTFFAHRDQNFIQTRSQIFNAGINIRHSN